MLYRYPLLGGAIYIYRCASFSVAEYRSSDATAVMMHRAADTNRVMNCGVPTVLNGYEIGCGVSGAFSSRI